MKKTFKIFISGTYIELQKERSAAEKVLTEQDIIPVSMPFSASPDSGLKIKRDECLSKLESCDAMLLIFGDRYGVPDLVDDSRSITEAEFDLALEYRISCYVFVKDPWQSREIDPKVKEQHEKFKAKVDKQKLWASFKNIDSLKYEILKALKDHPPEQEIAGKPFHDYKEFYYERLSEEAPPHLSLRHKILCRQDELKVLQDFSSNENFRILTILGGEGFGKSRLLLEWASKAPEDQNIFFLKELAFTDNQFDKACIDFIPHSSNSFVVFDDVHELRDIATAVLQLLIARPKIKIVLAGRPYFDYTSSIELLEQDHKIKYPLMKIELKQLSIDCLELKSYITEVLPQHARSPDFIEKIHHATGGMPWLLQFSILFIKEGGVLPTSLISRDPEFRKFVSGKILRAYEGTPTAHILEWLALISPIENVNQKEWREVFIKLMSVKNEDITAAIDIWLKECLLREKGRKRLFTSQIVQDFFVLKLCGSGELPKKIFDHFWNPVIENVLRNLSLGAALDTFGQPGQPSLLPNVFDEIWKKFREEAINDSPAGQCQIMKWLEPVAWYRPTHVRDLIAHIYANPSSTLNPDQISQVYNYTHKDVVEKFPTLLEAIAHHHEYFECACNILWELSKKDERETNPYPDHPMRVLERLASYQPGKRLWFTGKLVELVPTWIKNSSGKNFNHSPVKSILGRALSKEAEFSNFRGFTLSWGYVPIRVDLVTEIQNKALDIVFEIIGDQGSLYSESLMKEAIEELCDFATGPHKLSLARFTNEQEAQWTQRAQATLERIYEFIQKTTLIPIIRYMLWKQLEWLSQHGIDQLKQIAIKIRSSIDTTENEQLKFKLYQCARRDIFEEEEKWQERRNKVASALLVAFPDNKILIEFMTVICGEIRRFQVTNLDPFMVFVEMAKINSKKALEIAQSIVTNHHEVLKDYIPDLVGPLFQHPESVVDVRGFICKHLSQPKYLLYISEIYRRFPPKTLGETDYELLEDLTNRDMQNEPISLPNSLLHMTWRFLREEGYDRVRLKNLLFKIPLEGNLRATEDFFMILTGKEVFPLLTFDDKMMLVSRIEKLPKLDQAYHAEIVLNAIAKENPKLVVELIKNRFDLASQKKIERALPYHGLDKVFSEIHKHKDYADILRRVRDISMGLTEIELLEFKDMFAQLGAGFGKEVQDVLLEWIDCDVPEKYDKAVSLLSEAPNSFIFENVNFIDHLFRKLNNLPGDQHERRQHLRSSLFNMSIHGSYSRAPGTPSPKDQTILQGAEKIINEQSNKLCTETLNFYRSLSQYAIQSQEEERLRDEENFVE